MRLKKKIKLQVVGKKKKKKKKKNTARGTRITTKELAEEEAAAAPAAGAVATEGPAATLAANLGRKEGEEVFAVAHIFAVRFGLPPCVCVCVCVCV